MTTSRSCPSAHASEDEAATEAQGVLDWHTTTHDDLPAAIAEFKAALPGWWYSVCECQVSCDATIAPTTESPDIALVEYNSPFDVGFDVALEQPSSLAEALRFVVAEALAAKAALQTAPPPAEP